MIQKRSTNESKKLSKSRKYFFGSAAVMSVISSLFLGYKNVFAAECKTGILPQRWCNTDDGIKNMIQDIANVITALIFVAATGFIIYSGFIWATAADNPSRVATAKKRILEIVIGLIFFILIDAFINFLIPD